MKKIKFNVKIKNVISLCLSLCLVVGFLLTNEIKVLAASDMTMSYEIDNTDAVSKNGKRIITLKMSNDTTKTLTINSISIDTDGDFYSNSGTNITLLDSSLSASESNVTVATTEVIYKGTGDRFKYIVRYSVDGGEEKRENFSYKVKVKEEKNVIYEKEYIDVGDDREEPSLDIMAADNMDLNVTPGKEFDLKIVVKNTAGYKAKNVKLNIDLDNSIMNWAKYNGAINLDTIMGNRTKNYELHFKINENAKKGIYAIPIKAKYTNATGESFTSEDEIFINITNELIEPMVELRRVEYPEGSIEPEVPFNLNLFLENMGGIKAKNVKIVLTGLNKDGFMPQDITDTKYIANIQPNSIGVVTFPLIASNAIDRGMNELPLTVSYIDDNGKEYSNDMKVYLKVGTETGGLTSKSKPKIVISSYDLSDVPVKSGRVVTLRYTFTNTSSTKSINNVKVVVASEDGTFNIVGGTNSFWIESLGCKKSITKSIKLRARNDAKSNSYPISINFDYEDASGETYTSKEEIYAQVVEDLKLKIGDLELPYDAWLGSEATISFEYFNLGKSDISNLRVEVEGDVDSKDEVNYIGNLAPGDEDYGDIQIVLNKSGECSGILRFIFEDTNGDESELIKSFVLFVQEDSFMSDSEMGGEFEMPQEETKKGMARWVFILLIPIIVFVTALVTKIVIMKIYNKKIESEI